MQLAWHADAGCAVAGAELDAAGGNVEQWRSNGIEQWFAGRGWWLLTEGDSSKQLLQLLLLLLRLACNLHCVGVPGLIVVWLITLWLCMYCYGWLVHLRALMEFVPVFFAPSW